MGFLSSCLPASWRRSSKNNKRPTTAPANTAAPIRPLSATAPSETATEKKAPRPFSRTPVLDLNLDTGPSLSEKRDSAHSTLGTLIDEKEEKTVNTTTSYKTSAVPRHSRPTVVGGSGNGGGVPIRASTNPQFSAYSTPLGKEELKGLEGRASDDWVDTPTTARASTFDYGARKTVGDIGEEDEPEEDEELDMSPEAIKRRTRALEIKKEQEVKEQDRLDFFQMM